jgi:cytoskeletal protein CcmA (bactofilin family)
MSKNNQQTNETPNISLIGAGTEIIGEVVAKGDIRIDGSVKGKLNIQGKIVLGNSGFIEGEVIASNADISGSVNGVMSISDSLAMKSSSKIEGDIKVGKLSIEPGAYFNGNCQMGNNYKNNNIPTNAKKEKELESVE